MRLRVRGRLRPDLRARPPAGRPRRSSWHPDPNSAGSEPRAQESTKRSIRGDNPLASQRFPCAAAPVRAAARRPSPHHGGRDDDRGPPLGPRGHAQGLLFRQFANGFELAVSVKPTDGSGREKTVEVPAKARAGYPLHGPRLPGSRAAGHVGVMRKSFEKSVRWRLLGRGCGGRVRHGEDSDLRGELHGVEPGAGRGPVLRGELEVALAGPVRVVIPNGVFWPHRPSTGASARTLAPCASRSLARLSRISP